MPKLFSVASIAVHTAIVGGVLITELFATGPLPAPHTPLSFDGPMPVRIADIPLPAPARRAPMRGAGAPTAAINAAPVAEPSTIRPETGREGASARSIEPERIGETGILDAGAVAVITPLPDVASPATPVPVPVGGTIAAPRKLVDVAPVYPALAQATRVQGVVILEATIDTRGRVVDLRVLRSIPLLDQAAIDAVRQWMFTPTLLNGRPVPVVMTVTVNFTLQGR